MTADFISKKCGMVTIGVTNNQTPLQPLFSPVLNGTRPYSQTRSNTQRALMLPDEVLRMPNEQALVLLRGRKPLMLYKIIPDELPAFKKLTSVRIVDYMPEWRRNEEMLRKSLPKITAPKKFDDNPCETKIMRKAPVLPKTESAETLPPKSHYINKTAVPKSSIEETSLKDLFIGVNLELQENSITEESGGACESEALNNDVITIELSNMIRD